MVDAQDLIAWRKAMGWTQERAADQLGVSRRTYQSLESGSDAVPIVYTLACTHLASAGLDSDMPADVRGVLELLAAHDPAELTDREVRKAFAQTVATARQLLERFPTRA